MRLVILVVGGTFLIAALLIFGLPYLNEEGKGDQERPQIAVFYSPTCACCKEYISYLRRNGFEVEAIKTQDMLSVKEQYQISQEMEACHTSVIGDYFIEGHMPVEVIKKLLEEKPEISGIALPGMPPGSPGMGGAKKEPFKIYSLTNGQHSEFLSW